MQNRLLVLLLLLSISFFWLSSCVNGSEKQVIRRYYNSGILKKEFEVTVNEQTGEKVPDGYVRYYFENGKLKTQGQIKDGKRSGLYIYYFENGNPEQKAFFVNGELNGEFRTYYSDGKQKSIAHLVNGLDNDTSIFYYLSGNIMEKDIYDKGSLLYVVTYDENGKIRNQKWYAYFKSSTDSLKLGDSFKSVINVFEFEKLKDLKVNLACVTKAHYDKDSSNTFLKLRIQTSYYGEYFHSGYQYSCKVKEPGIYYITGDIEYIDPNGKVGWTEVKHRFVVYP